MSGRKRYGQLHDAGANTISRWGPGNFDGDMEAEYLQIFVDGIFDRVREVAALPAEMAPDEYGSIEMLGGLDIVRCLARHLGRTRDDEPCLFGLPSASELSEWKRRYLAAWDDWMVEMARPDNGGQDPTSEAARARRTSIQSTFDDLLELKANENA